MAAIPCLFVYESWPDDALKIYTCKTTPEIRMTSNVIETFQGEHYDRKTNKDVVGLKLSMCRMTTFPKNINCLLPALTHLSLASCDLDWICENDLNAFTNLYFLDLSHNKLQSIPDELFVKNQKLRWIFLNSNSIKHISSNVFLPFINSDLKHFDFRANPSINEYYSRGKHGSIQTLKLMIDANCKPPIKLAVKSSTHLGHFKKLFETGLLSDFIIRVGTKQFNVHKAVLAAQSSLFEGMFTSNAFKSFQTIKNFSYEAVEEFLHFLYVGNIRNMNHVQELLGLATQYSVQDLKTICEDIICDSITSATAMSILKLSIRVFSQKLKLAAFAEIEKLVGAPIDPSLINNPDKVMELVDLKLKFDSMVKKCTRSEAAK